MPNYQPNPYMEPPGFVVPHTNLHLMDYRRMLNPQYYQTMAYHSRRLRYQHNSQTREMTTSEVQTEPLSATQRTSNPSPSDIEASHDLPVSRSSHSPSVLNSQSLSPALAVLKEDRSLELKDIVPPSTTRTPPNSSFMIQTQEVRIECHTTPVGLQLVHSHETAEVSHSFSQDMVQCSSILQGHVLQDEGACLPAEQSEQAPHACPDILLVGTPGSGEKIPALEDESTATINANTCSQAAARGDIQETSSEKDLSMTSQNLYSRAYQLPFDPKYLDELRRMESTVWSVEETLIPSPEPLIHNDHTESYDEKMVIVGEVPTADALMIREEAPTEEIEEMPPQSAELEDGLPTADGPRDEMMSEADISPIVDATVAEETTMAELTNAAERADAPYLLLLDNSSLKEDGNQHRRGTNVQDHQDTSFESLPAYLPSTSWLADFENIHYSIKLPPTPKKQSRPLSSHGSDPPSRRRKLEQDYKEQPTVRKPKERYKPKGKADRRSLSDHECCLSRNFNENSFTPYVSKRERLCTRCLAKRRICTSASPEIDDRTLTRKALPFRQRNDSLLPTCEACKGHSKKELMGKGSSPDIHGRRRGHDTEGESSENGSCRAGPTWRAAEDPRKLGDFKRPLASKQNLVTCPAGVYPKLREKNCVCHEPRRQSVAWERLRHCPHGNAIREMDENCTMPVSFQDQWRNMDQIHLMHKCQTGNACVSLCQNEALLCCTVTRVFFYDGIIIWQRSHGKQ